MGRAAGIAIVAAAAVGAGASLAAVYPLPAEKTLRSLARAVLGRPAIDPIVKLKPADRAVAVALHAQIGTGLERFVAHPGTRAAIRNFYRGRGYAPLWVENGAATARAAAAAGYLRKVDADGLDPSDYPTPAFDASTAGGLAEAELRLTASILRFALDARGSRIELVRPDDSIEQRSNVLRSVDVLPLLAHAADIGELLDTFAPPHAGYRALKQKLAELRAGTLRPDQVIDARRGPPLTQPVDILIANMERWRWVPREPGAAHVIVNIADYSLRLVRDGEPVFRTKVVVGRPSWRTPVMSADMTSITLNPIWNVPRTIVEREYLPALRSDPSFAERLRLQVVERGDGDVHMYQRPSDVNALGRLRFNLPNRFDVYQHDTPEQFLFDMPVRAYSHGCMRVQDAAGYAEALLAVARPGEGFTRGRLGSMHGDQELEIEFKRPIPVHLTYQTAFVDDAGRLVVRDDIYRHDVRLTRALRGGGQTIASTRGQVQ